MRQCTFHGPKGPARHVWARSNFHGGSRVVKHATTLPIWSLPGPLGASAAPESTAANKPWSFHRGRHGGSCRADGVPRPPVLPAQQDLSPIQQRHRDLQPHATHTSGLRSRVLMPMTLLCFVLSGASVGMDDPGTVKRQTHLGASTHRIAA